MDRRDVLKGLTVAAGATMAATTEPTSVLAASGTDPAQLGPYAVAWDPADPDIPGRQNIARCPDDYFIPKRFAGKTVIVTGCARGMGEVAAVRLAREGANVVGVDILEGAGKAAVDRIVAEGHKAVFLAGDISKDSVCADMVALAVKTYGGLDAAINNAGVMDALFPDEAIDYVNQRDRLMARIHEAGDDYWRRVMEVNVTGMFYSMRHELRQMLKQERGGAIVNVASVAGLRGFGGTPPYVASKHAVQGLTKNAAIDYAPFGIRVNSVGMGTTLTPMYERAVQILTQRGKSGYKDTGIALAKTQSLLQYSDQKKMGSTAAEQVAIMLFLLSPESSNISGATYQTDGGYTTY